MIRYQTGIVTMKKLYYIILTLFTVTCCNAADSPPPGTPTEDDCRSTAMFSEAGSAGSMALESLLQPVEYPLPEDLRSLKSDELPIEFVNVAKAYSLLLEYVNARNVQIEDFSRMASQLLPDNSETINSPLTDQLVRVRQKFTKLATMLKKANAARKLTVEQNKALEARINALNESIAELTERNNELEQECATYQPLIAAKLNESTANEATIADLTKKVELAHSRTKQLFDQISTLEEELVSARAASERAKNGDTERDLAAAKTNLATVTAERDAEKARADTAAAEKNRLQAALAAAQSRQSDAAAGGDESTPLVVRRLNTGGETPAAVRGGAQPKKDEGCPCLVM